MMQWPFRQRHFVPEAREPTFFPSPFSTPSLLSREMHAGNDTSIASTSATHRLLLHDNLTTFILLSEGEEGYVAGGTGKVK
jgi:hypothetical protein